jgi:serine phosphatase RsbU (regulator of sigma subunit)
LAAAVTVLNNLLYENTSQMDRFVTLAAAVLDPVNHQVTLVNAGHPAPLLYRRANGNLEKADREEVIGLPLGVVEGFAYRATQIPLDPGDCLLFFSDGLTEALDQENNQLQLKPIYGALEHGPLSPQALGERIVTTVKQLAPRRSLHDDMTLVCFGRTPVD